MVPVVLFHAGFSLFGGGFVGVDIFFTISGYLITSIILSELEAGKFTLGRFYERRVRRILPALFFVMLCAIPLSLLLMRPPELVEFSESVVASTFFSSNILFWREGGYFGTVNDIKPLLHTWSLSVEEQYYIFFPLVVAACYKLRRSWVPYLIALAAVASFAINLLALQLSFVSLEATFFLLPTRAWEILFGALCALLLRRHYASPFRLFGHHVLREALPLLGLSMIGASIFLMDGSVPFPSQFALLPVIGACLIILFCAADTHAYRLLASRPFVGVGLISYSLYLWHQPILAFIRLAVPLDHRLTFVWFGLALLIPLSFLSYKYVEIPCRGLKTSRVALRPLLAGLGCTALLFIGFMVAVEWSKGFPQRYSASDQKLASVNARALGDYVAPRFEALYLKAFAQDGRSRILLIGDSFAQDFLNIVHETGRDRNVTISTFHITAACGNLDVDDRLVMPKLSPANRIRCNLEPRYKHPELAKRLAEADHIVLVSSWEEWQVPLISASLQSVARKSKADVTVIGRKDFGDIDLNAYLRVAGPKRRDLRNAVTPEHLRTNALMQRLPADWFVDFQTIVCGDPRTCPLFTEDGSLISFDGHHLTREGAIYSGRRLFGASERLRAVFP
ncbi:hypothetical protein ASE13_04950 [Sphingomonas sp. Root241]|nr:hypothetical protein ASE13_04950 [Sphingomonas sp. Root241]